MASSRLLRSQHPERGRSVVPPMVVAFFLCVSLFFLSSIVVEAHPKASGLERHYGSLNRLWVRPRELKGKGKGSKKDENGKSSKKKGKSKKSKKKGKSKKKKSVTLSPAPTMPFSRTFPPTFVESNTLPPSTTPRTQPPISSATNVPSLPPKVKSKRRPTTQPTAAPTVRAKSATRTPTKSATRAPTTTSGSPTKTPTLPTSPVSPTSPSRPTSPVRPTSPIRPTSPNPTPGGVTPSLPPSPRGNQTSTNSSTSTNFNPTTVADASPAPSAAAFAFSRSIATNPVTVEYEGVLDLAQKEDAIFMAVVSVLTPYLQQNVGPALRNYQLTLTYARGPEPNTYLSNVKVVLVLAGNSAQAVQGLTQDQANALLQGFFTGSTLKSLGDAFLAAGVNISTLGLYQQSSSGSAANSNSGSGSPVGSTTNATGSKIGPAGFVSIISGGVLVILASVAIMYGRRRQGQPEYRQFKSKDDSSLTSFTEADDGASLPRIGIRPVRFANDNDHPDGDMFATRQLIEKYRVLAPSVTELSDDDVASQSAYEFEGRHGSYDASSDGTRSLGYHDTLDPSDVMSEGDLDSTESMSTTDHQSTEYSLAACSVPSADLRMLNGPDLIAATTLPGSPVWSARSSFNYSASSSTNYPTLEEEIPATRSRRRWHEESEDEDELHPPAFTPSARSDAGSVVSQE